MHIDLHCHYVHPEAAEMASTLDPVRQEHAYIHANDLTRDVNRRQMQERAELLSDVDARIAAMDRMGIDIQAVSPSPFQYYYFADPDLGVRLARCVNDGIAALVAARPDRLVGLGTVPLQDSAAALRELNRAVGDLGLKGIQINGNVNGRNLTDPGLGLEPFFARAAELGAIVFLHPNGFSDACRLTDHYFNNVIGNPLETTVAASHLIFEGVMERHPDLIVLLAHGGGYLAHYWARMDHAHAAREDCRTIISEPPSTYLRRMYVDSITFDPRMIRQLLDVHGADRVVLGTDFPYDMGEEDPLGLIDSVPGLTEDERTMITGGTAARLLGLTAR